MISPAKFVKSIGNSKFKIGLSLEEMVLCAGISALLANRGVGPTTCFISLLGSLAILSIKNKLLAPSYIKNTLERKNHLKWEKIKYHD